MGNSHGVAGSTGSIPSLLYEAANSGSVSSLDRLVQQHGSVILSRVSLTSFSETPLHLAALLGHLEFSKRLLELRPELASEQDSEKCTPLHLAAANGHDHIVRELLEADKKACLVHDQEGRLPLHLAAMRGRVAVAVELLKPTQVQECLKRKTDDGDGILHLCVKYNHLDVLKVVLNVAGDEEEEILMMTDSSGNTVLHLAVMLKQRETVKSLLKSPIVKTKMINARNGMGYTALDALNHSPKDYKSLEIREILVAGIGAEGVRPIHPNLSVHQRRDEGEAAKVRAKAQQQVGGSRRTWRMEVWCLVNKLMDYRGEWMNETRGSLMMVSTLIATVTFAAAIAPPGGVWQQDTKESALKRRCGNNLTCYACSNGTVCYAGNAVFGSYYPYDYLMFMKYNMISFISSLVVVFLLISGFPLNNKFCLWLLSLVMCVTVSFLGLTFLQALWLMTPGELLHRYDKFQSVSVSTWATMICVVGIALLIRLSSWLRRMYHSPLLIAGWRSVLGCRSSLLKVLPANPCAHWKARGADTSKC